MACASWKVIVSPRANLRARVNDEDLMNFSEEEPIDDAIDDAEPLLAGAAGASLGAFIVIGGEGTSSPNAPTSRSAARSGGSILTECTCDAKRDFLLAGNEGKGERMERIPAYRKALASSEDCVRGTHRSCCYHNGIASHATVSPITSVPSRVSRPPII